MWLAYNLSVSCFCLLTAVPPCPNGLLSLWIHTPNKFFLQAVAFGCSKRTITDTLYYFNQRSQQKNSAGGNHFQEFIESSCFWLALTAPNPKVMAMGKYWTGLIVKFEGQMLIREATCFSPYRLWFPHYSFLSSPCNLWSRSPSIHSLTCRTMSIVVGSSQRPSHMCSWPSSSWPLLKHSSHQNLSVFGEYSFPSLIYFPLPKRLASS